MRCLRWVQLGLAMAVTAPMSGSVLWAAEGIVFKNADASGVYCHLRFPAIREDTLSDDRPVLKDPAEGDIIDFYGPCDHDPLGKDEVHRQKSDWRRFRDRIDGETD